MRVPFEGEQRVRAEMASDRIKRFLGRPPFLILQAVLQRIPFRPIQIARFEVLRLEAGAKRPAVRDNGENVIREASRCDMESLVRCLDKRDIYARRFAAGDSCIVSVMQGRIIGYEWLCASKHHIEEQSGYKLPIPGDALYAYDAYVRPEYRRSGIWVRVQEQITRRLEKWGRKSIIAMVEYGNDVSRKAHLTYGYSPIKRVWYMRVLSLKLSREKPIPRKIAESS